MQLSEAEIQVLASLDWAIAKGSATDRSSLEDSGQRFAEYLEDWSDAFDSLREKGLISGDAPCFDLTDQGRPLAKNYNEQRPDRYWYYYQTFYPAAYASKAHSKLCERVFGKDLCQEGQVDMEALNNLLARMNLMPGDHVLDLGCGAGGISKYIADETGAFVTGLDYAHSAIDEANERTASSQSRVKFVQGDFNALDFPPRSFSAVISLDTLYWAADMKRTMSKLVEMLRAGGQIGVFIAPECSPEDPPHVIEPENTRLGRALSELGLSYDAVEYTPQLKAFWERNLKAAQDLRAEFEAEGNSFIADSLITEAADQYLPGLEAGTIKRYLYHVTI